MKEKLKELIFNVLTSDVSLEEIELLVPKDNTNGDYASNIALKLAKKLNKNPLEIANMIKDNLQDEIIDKISIAHPGFINFYLKKDYLLNHINVVFKEKENYGKINIGNNSKVNVEFVSANPTGLIHCGTARCAAFGDSLSNLLEFAGYNVTREYYFNDGGIQIENLGKSLKARYEEICGITSSFPEDGYHGHEIIEIAQILYKEEKELKLDEDIEFFSKYASDYLIKIIKEDLKDFRVTFDVFTSEQSFRNDGSIEKCLEVLKKDDNIYEMDGATWLKSTKYGDDKDRVLIKSDGNYTYIVPDIAYHLDKINRGYSEIIDVLGADHHGYISRLKASIEALGYPKDKIHVKLVQMVKLLRDSEEIKMSKRTGQTLTMRELMNEVGVDAARYFFSSKSLDTQMDFDIDLAKKKSNENPVYYVSYAHARICSILNNNKEKLVNWFSERIYSKYIFGDYSSLNFSGEVFTYTDFRFARFNNSILINTNFEYSSLTGVNFRGANMENACLDYCSIHEADFTNAMLKDASFKNARAKAGLTSIEKWEFVGFSPTNFRNANLIGADFTRANLTGANFAGANLSDADFSGAVLLDTDFTDTILDNTIFDDCIAREKLCNTY